MIKKIYYTIFLVKTLSVILALVSTNWLTLLICFEVNLYSTIPFLMRSGSKSVCFYYWIFQSVGSLIFFLGILLKTNLWLVWLSLFLKMSYFPLFFWIPSLVKNMTWDCLVLVLVKKKIPSFIGIYLVGCPESFLNFSLAMLVFFCSKIFLVFQKKIFSFMAWSSNVQSSCLFLVLNESMIFFAIYFFFYSVVILFLSFSSSQFSLNLGVTKLVWSLFLLSGIPPLFVFLYKVWFFFMVAHSTKWGLLVLLGLGFFFSFMAYMSFIVRVVTKKSFLGTKSFFRFFFSFFFVLAGVNLLMMFF